MSEEETYGSCSYWNTRYQQESTPFDWYQSFIGLKSYFESLIKLQDDILMVGCGNSLLSEQMYEAGYKSIVSMDISPVVIEQQNLRYRDKYPDLQFLVENALDMSFQDNTFDIVLDKGTFDTIMCGDNSQENALIMCQEINRVLKPGGKYIIISYGAPKDRESHFSNACEWKRIDIQTIKKPDSKKSTSVHYIYIMTKLD
ncbi:hypothetical protein CYY_003245 [Polysphondylium violaceum]|uniref:Methyltransferase type 11 domain-containing protein n=1 Tax=Polysphondylium violaceum TaxID=133409 RepID=A0A8J4V8W3_9MYCE|nr:hypothetical protein CYY_003245 [Polysphondylium violaceum]